jgi:hypothetical protein
LLRSPFLETSRCSPREAISSRASASCTFIVDSPAVSAQVR